MAEFLRCYNDCPFRYGNGSRPCSTKVNNDHEEACARNIITDPVFRGLGEISAASTMNGLITHSVEVKATNEVVTETGNRKITKRVAIIDGGRILTQNIAGY